MAKSEGGGLGYGPLCDTVSRPDINYALPPIIATKIGCADMPRGAPMPLLPLLFIYLLCHIYLGVP